MAILNSYFVYEEYSHKTMSLPREYVENQTLQVNATKELARLDRKAAHEAITQLKSDTGNQKPQVEQLLKNGNEAALEATNCEEAASKYFESSSPSEGLNKLCPIPTGVQK